MLKIFCKFIPIHSPFLTSPVHPFTHCSYCKFIEPDNAIMILTNSIILKMHSHLCFQEFPPLFGFDLISYRFKLLTHFLWWNIRFIDSKATLALKDGVKFVFILLLWPPYFFDFYSIL